MNRGQMNRRSYTSDQRQVEYEAVLLFQMGMVDLTLGYPGWRRVGQPLPISMVVSLMTVSSPRTPGSSESHWERMMKMNSPYGAVRGRKSASAGSKSCEDHLGA